MNDDWGLIKNDCLLFSPSLHDDSILMQCNDTKDIISIGYDGMIDGGRIKSEPDDRDSDYHGSSSSNSPSSLSESMGTNDMSPLILSSHQINPFQSSHHHTFVDLHSSNGLDMIQSMDNCHSSFDSVLSCTSTLQLVPSSSSSINQFNQYSPSSSDHLSSHHIDHGYFGDDIKYNHKECSQSPDMISSPSSPLSPSPSSTIDPLYHNRMQIRSRSKMHEMALEQRLITEQDPRGSGVVILSGEERRTLIQEGYNVPSKLPLTKSEEEALRIVRRKIKNKLSAQESRRKRKEYIDTLEQRCQVYASENAHLKAKLKQMENQLRKMNGRI